MTDEIDSKFMLFSPWTFIFALLILILGNLLIIDAALFWNKNTKTNVGKVQSQKIDNTKISVTPISTDTCGKNCKAEIQLAIAEAKIGGTVSTTQSSSKEYYVPLGSGGSTSSEWTDVPGVQGYIDSTSYGKIKTVTFEASLHTPTNNQEAEARLYNVSDSHPVWNSEVKISGGTPQLKISSPIKLDGGSKLYQVQMKTQLQSRTNLENARVRIITY